MPRAAVPPGVSPRDPRRLINEWATHELSRPSIPPPSPGTVAGRCQILARVLDHYEEDGYPAGARGLFTAPPEAVASFFFGRRYRSNRRERNTRRMESALEDFRAWFTVQQNRGS